MAWPLVKHRDNNFINNTYSSVRMTLLL